MRRFTRRTDAFFKKLENHAAMVALYFMYYNFARASDDPCDASDGAGISDHVWPIKEIVDLLN